MTGRLAGRVVLVSGGGAVAESMSNGRAAAIGYAREGARVLVVDRDGPSAAETVDQIRHAGGVAEPFAGDMTRSADVESMVGAARAAFGGRVDVLHNNIGIVRTGGPVELDESDWDLVVSVNLKPMFLTAKHVLPLMVEQRSGVVVNVGSMAGLRYTGVPMIAYSTTKAAVPAFTRTVAMQYAHNGIRANSIHPGVIDTPMQRISTDAAYDDALGVGDGAGLRKRREATIPLGRFGTPDEVADAAVFLASDDARYITGTDLVVDGGFTQRAG